MDSEIPQPRLAIKAFCQRYKTHRSTVGKLVRRNEILKEKRPGVLLFFWRDAKALEGFMSRREAQHRRGNPSFARVRELRKTGHSYKEISAATNVPLTTVASWLKSDFGEDSPEPHDKAVTTWYRGKKDALLERLRAGLC